MNVVHQRYVAYSDAHYAGNLVDGAYSLKLFGDAGTHLASLGDGHESLFAGYSSVEFLAPIRGGDVIEVEISGIGTLNTMSAPYIRPDVASSKPRTRVR